MQHNLEFIFKQCIKSNSSLNIIIANGEPPKDLFLHQLLKQANCIVCCDGAMTTLESINIIPTNIIGDCDSLSSTQKEKYADIIKYLPDQNTNDLTKAINFAVNELHLKDIIILGATGLREDHSLANLSLFIKYAQTLKNMVLVSDYGFFRVYTEKVVIPTVPNQQISLFPINNQMRATTQGLKWDLNDLILDSWNKQTLNEAKSYEFGLDIKEPILVYQTF